MDIREILRIDQVHSGDKSTPAGKPGAFAAVLKELQERATSDAVTDVKDIGQLKDAMQRAEDDFASLMDLRRKLEDAWRSHNS